MVVFGVERERVVLRKPSGHCDSRGSKQVLERAGHVEVEVEALNVDGARSAILIVVKHDERTLLVG